VLKVETNPDEELVKAIEVFLHIYFLQTIHIEGSCNLQNCFLVTICRHRVDIRDAQQH
jgi:hypothetical protein